MSYHYSNPARVGDPHALPDVEVFYVGADEIDSGFSADVPGWYWWYCSPGCLPEGEGLAHGPFASEAEAAAAAVDDGIEADGPWDTDGQLPNENGESSERENDAYARRNYRD